METYNTTLRVAMQMARDKHLEHEQEAQRWLNRVDNLASLIDANEDREAAKNNLRIFLVNAVEGTKINTIKALREGFSKATGETLGLKEAKDMVDAVMDYPYRQPTIAHNITAAQAATIRGALEAVGATVEIF